jgi:hypothetical protein
MPHHVSGVQSAQYRQREEDIGAATRSGTENGRHNAGYREQVTGNRRPAAVDRKE